MTEDRKNKIAYIFGLAISLIVLIWICFSINPGITGRVFQKTDLTGNLLSSVNNAKSDAMSDVAYIEKIKKIPLSDTFAPNPSEECYGTIPCEDASEMKTVIERARELGVLEDQDVIFNLYSEFYGDEIKYYLDETLFVICWQEKVNNRTCYFSEIKVKDASQFRRKLSADKFNSGITSSLKMMSQEANAVVAMNGDYYNFRDFGICVYQSELKRFRESSFNPGTVSYSYIDSLFIDNNGDFHAFKKGSEISREEMEKFIFDNGIMFSLSFGPLIIDNYKVIRDYNYPIGEVYKSASRAGIAQYDKLHYLYANVQACVSGGADMSNFASIMASKNVKYAYNLDGGQTAEIVMNNRIMNSVDYGAERFTSDCIYFASAAGIKE